MGSKTVSSRAKAASKVLGKSTKGNGGGKKRAAAKTTIRPGKVGGSYGIKIKRTF